MFEKTIRLKQPLIAWIWASCHEQSVEQKINFQSKLMKKSEKYEGKTINTV